MPVFGVNLPNPVLLCHHSHPREWVTLGYLLSNHLSHTAACRSSRTINGWKAAIVFWDKDKDKDKEWGTPGLPDWHLHHLSFQLDNIVFTHLNYLAKQIWPGSWELNLLDFWEETSLFFLWYLKCQTKLGGGWNEWTVWMEVLIPRMLESNININPFLETAACKNRPVWNNLSIIPVQSFLSVGFEALHCFR